MITESRKSFEAIYGKNAKEFVSKLYDIYKYDKARKALRKVSKQRS
jgi:S-adenosylmethionine synthetase